MAAHIGLDIGTQFLKVCQVTKTGDNYQLAKIGYTPAPQKSMSSEAQVDHEVLAETIKKLVHDTQFDTKKTVLSIPETQVFNRIIQIPQVSDSELESAIKWEAEQYIPLPLEETRLAWQSLFKDEKAKKINVLLIAAPSILVDKYEKISSLAGLSPVAVETEMLSLIRTFYLNSTMPTSLLIDIGAQNTSLAVVKKGGILIYNRAISTAGNAITRAVASELGLELSQAEEYKKSYGLDQSKLSGKVVKAILPIYNAILNEIKRGIIFCQEKFPDDIVKRIVISGGTASLPHLVATIASQTGVETQIGNPLSNLSVSDKTKQQYSPIGSMFAVAVGLAMKEI